MTTDARIPAERADERGLGLDQGSSDKLIRFPTEPSRRRLPWRRITTVGATVAVVLAGGGWLGLGRPHSCGGVLFDRDLHRSGDQCIGAIDTRQPLHLGDAAFGADIRTITKLVQDQNEWVESDGRKWVRVGVMMPMTGSGTESAPVDQNAALPTSSIINALRGAYIAQYRANTTVDFGANQVLVELELMNEGSQQDQWQTLTGTIQRQVADKEHPLVAVVGLGPSREQTSDIARYLDRPDGENAQRVPAVGAMISAVEAPGMVNISASNADYVAALDRYLAARPALRTTVEAVDRKGKEESRAGELDLYTKSMHEEFAAQLPRIDPFPVTFTGSTGTGDVDRNNFTDVAATACGEVRGEDVDTVLFGGRARDLQPLLEMLAAKCPDKSLTILTASTGATIDVATKATLARTGSTLVMASSADAEGWSPVDDRGMVKTENQTNPPAGFAPFLKQFLDPQPSTDPAQDDAVGFTKSDLIDGYAIGYHDAVAVAASAIHRARSADDTKRTPPSAGDVATKIENMTTAAAEVVGAGGTFTFQPEPRTCGKIVALTVAEGSQVHPLPGVSTCTDEEGVTATP